MHFDFNYINEIGKDPQLCAHSSNSAEVGIDFSTIYEFAHCFIFLVHL